MSARIYYLTNFVLIPLLFIQVLSQPAIRTAVAVKCNQGTSPTVTLYFSKIITVYLRK